MRLLGVYQIESADQRLLRIGEGFIAARVREHLKGNSGWVSQARQVRYFVVCDKEVAEVMERLLLLRHKLRNNGTLPPGNSITA